MHVSRETLDRIVANAEAVLDDYQQSLVYVLYEAGTEAAEETQEKLTALAESIEETRGVMDTRINPKHWYLVHYTASDPFNRVMMEATHEVALDHLWNPGTLEEMVSILNDEMLKAGYKQYTNPIVTSVHYMGVFDA